MVNYNESSIIQFDNVFSIEDYNKILDYVYDARWQFGHGSFDPSDPRSRHSYPFWGMPLKDIDFFSQHLLNIIEKKTQQKYNLYDVYANGHTFGTKGSFHQDWYDETGRTFLFYANEEWNVDWGGKTVFDFGSNYYFNVPKPNSAILFPGCIPHSAEGTSRNFSGLRITIAWKLLLK